MPGTHPARRCRLSPRTSLTRVLQELLEQPAQFERRAPPALGHHRRRDGARAIGLSIANRRAAQSRPSPLSPPPTAPPPTLAPQQLPAGTGAGTRRILASDETAAIESDDVETTILRGRVERAAHNEALAVTSRFGEAGPVGHPWRLRGVALRLPATAGEGDDVAL